MPAFHKEAVHRFRVSQPVPLRSLRPLFVRRAGLQQRPAEPQRFTDFLGLEDAPKQAPASPDEKAEELISRAAAVLAAAQAALDDVRQRDPAEGRYRRTGTDVTAGPTVTVTSNDEKVPATDTGTTAARTVRAPFLAWQSDTDEEDGEGAEEAAPPPPPFSSGAAKAYTSPDAKPSGGGGSSSSGTGAFGSGMEGSNGWGPAGVDTWFGDKVDTGPVAVRASSLKPSGGAAGVAVLDRPNLPTSLEFSPPDAPEESGAASIFPKGLALRFQSTVQEEVPLDAATPAEEASAPDGLWERTSGEEFGANGYWYRWTEIRGRDASGTVQWSERWWEASDWAGMREMGAEKWGNNAAGDAWRETWRECIGFDASNGQPMVERSAHKWARNARGGEWEEKWGESYCSGGKASKFADKWGREGGDVWHEKWGEDYDGEGGCRKYTDRWAERPTEGGGLHKWGDKWEETFKDGRGCKKGETWSEGGAGERYNRWWGENHFGDGSVQRFGHSTEGEHWDATECMDTYYNPIPHFGYDLALAHSPQLRQVPMLPRDQNLDGGSGGRGGGGLADIL